MNTFPTVPQSSQDWLRQYYDLAIGLLGVLVFCLGIVVNDLGMFIGGMVLIAIGIFVAIAFRIIFRY